MSDVSIMFIGRDEDGPFQDGPIDLGTPGLWRDFQTWVRTLPSENRVYLGPLADDFEVENTFTLAEELAAALVDHDPPDGPRIMLEKLIEHVGVGAADETATVTIE